MIADHWGCGPGRPARPAFAGSELEPQPRLYQAGETPSHSTEAPSRIAVTAPAAVTVMTPILSLTRVRVRVTRRLAQAGTVRIAQPFFPEPKGFGPAPTRDGPGR